ncbi:Low-density lipoprotein receptor-related protein 4 [Holothuria leucospilota]|uniref:Low-density lipoprotein receptor-related protein 4 n=1 Tax=Holothuria leucospilota TaxID=206669 RepID=A0A9Q1CE63_HOLLE|nr:Low-density lipoprotein receptor-related protein 4 [Holothuria leucospilota]
MDSTFFSSHLFYFLFLLSTCTSSGRACFVSLNNSVGEFTNHLYPQVNLMNLRCTWRLTAPAGQVVEITFDEVNFDNSTDESGNCIDSVTVFSGDSTEIIPPFCGVGPPWPRLPIRLLSTENIMTVTMEKTLPGSKGFRASYKHVPPRREIIATVIVEEPSILLPNRLGSNNPSPKIPLIGSSDPYALSFDPIRENFYFTDIQQKFIGRIRLDGKVVHKVVEGNIDNPLGVAVAYLTGLLYWTDADRHEVSVSRLDGSLRKTLLKSSFDCRTPKGIVLTLDNKKIFWTCESRIQTSEADGSNRNPNFISVDVVDPSAITIDPTGVYLYWLDTHLGVVERVRVDGFGRIESLSSSSDLFQYHHSLTMDDLAYFFTNTNDQKLHIIERHATKPRSRTLQLIPPKTFRGLYHYNSALVIPDEHVCAISNGGCNEFCFPTEDSFTCIDVTPRIFNCPGNILKSSSLPFETIDWLEPTAISRSSDQNANVPYQSRSHAPMSAFLRGSTRVVYVFEDEVGNGAECSFNVTIQPSFTTVFTPTSSQVTESSSTYNSQGSSNDAFFTSEYIIIGLIILLVSLTVAIVVAVLCCCGCCKCECSIKKRRDRTEQPMIWTNELAPNIHQQYPVDNSLYLRALPYETKEDNYITVMA